VRIYVQMAGRGTRLAPGKADCLVLDFAGNVARHGPIDAVKPKKPGSGDGEAPVKICPDCQSILATAVRVCPDCGHAFPPPKVQVEREASTLAILTTVKPQWLRVDGVSYRAHEKPGSRPTLQVEYQCGLMRHREWVCFEHTGYARQKAAAWWRQRAPGKPVPGSVGEALAWSRQIAAPCEIAVRPRALSS
jgi:DNA repair protein RadD